MVFKKIVVVSVLMVLSSLSAGYEDKGSWTYVKQIYVPTGGGKIFVYFEENGLPGCYSNNGAYIPTGNVEGANRVHSTLLAALMANKKVQAFYNYTSSDQSSWSRCTLEAVYVQ